MRVSLSPSRAEQQAARNKTIPDVLGPGLKVLFCGINPGLYSAATGHHFARPGNRFWPALHQAGFTPRLFRAEEDHDLMGLGYGLTNLVARATGSADELSREELLAGPVVLLRKVRRFQPKIVAVVGIGAYRTAFARPKAVLGRQAERLAEALLWALPNPSGLNAHYQLTDLADLFAELRLAFRA